MNEIYKAAFVIDTMHKIKTGEITKKAEIDKMAKLWPMLLSLGVGLPAAAMGINKIRSVERRRGQREIMALLRPLIMALRAPAGNLTRIPSAPLSTGGLGFA